MRGEETHLGSHSPCYHLPVHTWPFQGLCSQAACWESLLYSSASSVRLSLEKQPKEFHICLVQGMGVGGNEHLDLFGFL